MPPSCPSLHSSCSHSGFAAAALALPAPGESGSTAAERRPDLVQRTLSDLQTRETSRGFEIGFDSAVEHHGNGPLRVHGHRLYMRSAGHDHWYYLFFGRYELRRLYDQALVRPRPQDRLSASTADTGSSTGPTATGACAKSTTPTTRRRCWSG